MGNEGVQVVALIRLLGRDQQALDISSVKA